MARIIERILEIIPIPILSAIPKAFLVFFQSFAAEKTRKARVPAQRTSVKTSMDSHLRQAL